MKKIAIFTDMFVPSTNGVATSIVNQIKGLVKNKYKVIVFAPGETNHVKRMFGAKVYYVKSRGYFYPDFRMSSPRHLRREIYRALKKEEPDLYHIETPFTVGLAGTYYGKKFKKPIISTYHGDVETYVGHLTKGRFENFLKNTLGRSSMMFIRYLSSYSDKVVVPGKSIEKHINRRGIKNTVLIPNGIDKIKVPKKKVDVRKKYDIPKDAQIILYFGRISFEKKIPVLLKAFKELKKKNKNVFLVVGGGGPDVKRLKKRAKKMELEDYVFTGYVHDNIVPFIYKEASLFASASDTETQGITFCEAMMFSKPLVGTDKFGANDMIIDGLNGYKFRPGKYKSMAKKMDLILKNKKLAKIMGKNSKKMTKEYTMDKFVSKLIKLYKEYL